MGSESPCGDDGEDNGIPNGTTISCIAQMPRLNLKRSYCISSTASSGGPDTVSGFDQSVKAWVFGWGPAALWAAVLFLLSEIEGLGRGLPTGGDKLAHGGLYFMLGLSLAWGKRRIGAGVPGLLLLLMGVGYGALDEWHQSFVPGRYSSVGDWVADSAGVMLGLVLFSRFSSRSRDNEGSPYGSTTPNEGTTTTGSA
jgi:VanZ family protein